MIAVQQSNERLLFKLSEISKGKLVSSHAVVKPHCIKSLNQSKNKRVVESITYENCKLMSRIISKKASISNQTLKKNYDKSLKLKSMMSKASRVCLYQT